MRVALKNENPNYSHASFVHVRHSTYKLLEVIEEAFVPGLPSGEGFHYSPESHEEHCQRLLEDGGGSESACNGHTLQHEGGGRGLSHA